MKNIAVFLDEFNEVDGIPSYADEWKYCRNFDEFSSYIEEYYKITDKLPVLISISHDLCLEHVKAESIRFPTSPIFYSKFKSFTGFTAAKWLIEFSKKNKVSLGRIAIHGNNELGKSNIMYELQKYKNETSDPVPAFMMTWKYKQKEHV